MEVAVRPDDRQPGLGLTEPLHQLGDARGVQQRRVGHRDRRFGPVDPVHHRLVPALEGPVEGQVHPGRHGAQLPGLGPEVAPGDLWRAAGRVEVAQGRQGERPASGAVGQRLLHHAEVAPLPGPTHQRGGDVVETGCLERHHEIDVGAGLRSEPREHEEVAPVATVEDGGIVVVAQHRHRSGAGFHAAHHGQQQRGQLGVTQRVSAHGEPVLVVEQAERRLVTGAEEMGLVGHSPQPRDEMRPPIPHPGHDVDQARPAGQDHLGPLNHDRTLRRGPPQPQPRLGQRAQRLVAGGRHSRGRPSSRARSNHRKP